MNDRRVSPAGSTESDATMAEKHINDLPRIPFNLRDHSLAIAIYWSITVLSCGVLPIALYFILKYAANVTTSTNLGICVAVAGVSALYSLFQRTWRLFKSSSTCRPLGVTSRWAFDFFHWNFIIGTVVLAAIMTVGSSIPSTVLCAIPTAVLVLYVSIELLAAALFVSIGMRLPFRMSSLAKGDRARSGCYVIVEDVIAVDGGQGQEFRRVWSERYEASPALRTLLFRLDLLWGVTGLLMGAAVLAVALAVDQRDVFYSIGWGLPWVWAGVLTVVTIQMTKAMLAVEAQGLRSGVNMSERSMR